MGGGGGWGGATTQQVCFWHMLPDWSLVLWDKKETRLIFNYSYYYLCQEDYDYATDSSKILL